MELVAERVGHRYGGLRVLEDVSFTLADREILAVIGPSGCGKSTLLAILGGLLAPAEGRVGFHGQAPANCLNPFTYVFQDFALLPWRTVEQNVSLALEHHTLAAADRSARIGHALALTGLAEFAGAYPRQLSGGMRQRVGIARAIAVAPAVLFLDEPLSALDAQTRALLLEDLLAIFERERTTAIWVTHHLEEALEIADRVLVLSRRPGRLLQAVSVDVPRAQRRATANAGNLAMLRERLWSLIKGEAVEAEREVLRV